MSGSSGAFCLLPLSVSFCPLLWCSCHLLCGDGGHVEVLGICWHRWRASHVHWLAASKQVEANRAATQVPGASWVKVASGNTTRTGAFSILTSNRASTTTYRVHAAAATLGLQRYPAVWTPTKKITTEAQSGRLTLPATSEQGATVRATAVFKPARTGRPVALQVKNGSDWSQVATGEEASNGSASLLVPSSSVGSFAYRAIAKEFNGAVAVATPSKTITVAAAPTDTAPPPAPTGLVADPGDASVHLTWSAVSATDLAGYNVYQATSSGGPWAKVTASPIIATSYDAAGLANGTTYWFAIASVDTSGNESSRSTSNSATPKDETTPDTTPPPVPSGLIASPGETTVHLSWSEVAAENLAGYNVYRAASSDGPWTKLTSSPITATSYDATELANGTTYWFATTSVDTTGNESAKSTLIRQLPQVQLQACRDHCGTLTASESWRAASVHRVTCSVSVPAGLALTIEPGAIVKFAGNTGIDVEGSLHVEGAGTDLPVLTSIQDDAAGGDTNEDGTATTPTAGIWRGLVAADSASVTVANAQVRYAVWR